MYLGYDVLDAEETAAAFAEAWALRAAEEGLADTLELARQIEGGLATGHYCEGLPEQRRAAQAFLALHK